MKEKNGKSDGNGWGVGFWTLDIIVLVLCLSLLVLEICLNSDIASVAISAFSVATMIGATAFFYFFDSIHNALTAILKAHRDRRTVNREYKRCKRDYMLYMHTERQEEIKETNIKSSRLRDKGAER